MRQFDDSLKSDDIIEALNSLPVDRQVEIFAGLSPQAREQFIQSLSRPEEILSRVSEEELYFTVKQLGEENAPGLLAYSTPNQLLYFADLDLWKKDMLDFKSVARWLNIISELGQEKMVQFVEAVEPELLVAVLRSFVRVQARNPDLDFMDQSDVLPVFTMDDTFFIEFLVRDSEEAIKSFLDAVFCWDTVYYFRLMHVLMYGLHSENEEIALRWHRARLADKGFPVFEEALEIYRYLRQSEIDTPATQIIPCVTEMDSRPHPLLAYPLKVIAKNDLFRRSLDEIAESGEKDRIVTELAHVANKIMVADAKDPGSLEDLLSSLSKVSGYINISLEDVCGNDVSVASGVLSANHMEILFRRGFSLILDLRKQARILIRQYEGGMENLGHPLAGLMRGLFQKRPVFAGDLLGKNKPRDFESMADLKTIRNLLDKDLMEQGWEPI